MDKVTTFEKSYRKYPFAELVRLATAFGKWIAERRGHKSAAGLSMGEIYAARVQGWSASLPLRKAA